MKRLLQILSAIALVLLCGVLYQAEETLRETRHELGALLTDTRRVVLSIGGTAANVRAASDEAKQASIEQRKYWAQAAQQTNKDLADFDTAIKGMGDTLQTLRKAIEHADADIGDVTRQSTASIKQIGDTLAELKPVISKATENLNNLALITGDPAILETLRHVDATSANVESATGHVDKSTATIETAVKNAFTPGKLWKRVLEYLLGKAANLRQAIGR